LVLGFVLHRFQPSEIGLGVGPLIHRRTRNEPAVCRAPLPPPGSV
jgi:hypothetical protein